MLHMSVTDFAVDASRKIVFGVDTSIDKGKCLPNMESANDRGNKKKIKFPALITKNFYDFLWLKVCFLNHQFHNRVIKETDINNPTIGLEI